MTGEPSPLTHKAPEELIALLMAGLLALVSSLLDATFLPSTHRDRLHAAFADLFARLEAQLIAGIQQQIALTALKQPEPTPAAQPAKPPAPARRSRTKTTHIPSAPPPTSAPTETPPTAEAPHLKRAPAPHHPTRAPSRAVAPSTIFTLPNSQNLQKTPYTPTHLYAHFVTISQ